MNMTVSNIYIYVCVCIYIHIYIFFFFERLYECSLELEALLLKFETFLRFQKMM